MREFFREHHRAIWVVIGIAGGLLLILLVLGSYLGVLGAGAHWRHT